MAESKPVLDATCASRMMWFDKNDSRTLFVDRRWEEKELLWESPGKKVFKNPIHPDVIADFTDLPFEDNTFYHVVFDPPHLTQLSDKSWMGKRYGVLPHDENEWRKVIHDGFHECMRVLKPNGTLIFKWCEYEIPVKEIIKAIDCKPLYGTRSGKQANTIWMAFIKDGV